MQRISGSTADSRPLSLFVILAIFLLAASHGFSGCAKSNGDTSADAGQAADSTAVADSSQADSSKSQGKSGGLLARFRHGDDKDKKEDEEPRIPVELAEVTRDDVPSYLGATASLEPEKQVDVQSKAAGQIQSLRAEEGDWVIAGQLLAQLDGEAEAVALKEATLRAEAREREFKRGEALHDEQGISNKEQLDLRFQWEEAEAQRKAAEIGVANTRILAPFGGRIVERRVDPGQHLTAGTTLYRLVDSDPLLAQSYLPEKQAMRIAPGQAVVVAPDTQPELELPGEVLRVAPIVDTRTGTVKITCRIAGQEGVLRPGSFVRVKVQTDMHRDVLVIPKRALVPEGGETYVFKAVADSVIKVSVRTGFANGRNVEVLEGLDLGERVVSVGTGSLRPGTKIKDLGAEGSALADSTPAEDDAS